MTHDDTITAEPMRPRNGIRKMRDGATPRNPRKRNRRFRDAFRRP